MNHDGKIGDETMKALMRGRMLETIGLCSASPQGILHR